MRPFVAIALLFIAGVRGQAADQELIRIRGEVEEALRRELIDCVYPRCIDQQRGGFHQAFDRDWSKIPDENASVVAQARHTWTVAAFARFSKNDREVFTGYARHGLKFLDTALVDHEQGGVYWAVDANGQPSDGIGTDKHAYGAAFAIYAASEVYRLTQDPLASQLAKRVFDWLEQHAHDPRHGGYFEAFDRRGTPRLSWLASDPKWKRNDSLGVYFGYKTMNSHIHLLEAFTVLAKIDDRPIVRERLREVFEIVRDRIVVPPGVMCLYFTPDWRATAAHDSFGHDVETAFLLIEAAEELGMADDALTWDVARSLVDHALDWGWDEKHGGFYDKGDAFAGEAFDTDKIWWVQAEGLNALLLMHHRFGSQTSRYRDAFIAQWRFIHDHSLDQEHGGWYWETDREGKPQGTGQKMNAWKAAYHTGRSLMHVIERIDTINAAKE